MEGLIIGIAAVVVLALIVLALALHIVQQCERGVVFRFGRLIGEKEPELAIIIALGSSKKMR